MCVHACDLLKREQTTGRTHVVDCVAQRSTIQFHCIHYLHFVYIFVSWNLCWMLSSASSRHLNVLSLRSFTISFGCRFTSFGSVAFARDSIQNRNVLTTSAENCFSRFDSSSPQHLLSYAQWSTMMCDARIWDHRNHWRRRVRNFRVRAHLIRIHRWCVYVRQRAKEFCVTRCRLHLRNFPFSIGFFGERKLKHWHAEVVVIVSSESWRKRTPYVWLYVCDKRRALLRQFSI